MSMELKQIRESERRMENEKRKQKIIEAAFSCFSKKGVEAASFSEIAAVAVFGEATLYRYFLNKETLVLECGKWFWTMVYDFMVQWSGTPEFQALKGMEQVESLIRGALVFYRTHRDGFRVIHNLDGFLLSHRAEPEQLLAYERAVDSLRPCLCDAIQRGKQDGSIDDDVETQELYYAVTTGIMSVMQKLAGGNLLSSDEIVNSDKKLELFLELLIAGVRSACGKRKG